MSIENKKTYLALGVQLVVFVLIPWLAVFVGIVPWLIGALCYLVAFASAVFIWNQYHPAYKEWSEILLYTLMIVCGDIIFVLLLAILSGGAIFGI